jgi:two-component system phosphate regulon sensor histidine kinase PhoR
MFRNIRWRIAVPYIILILIGLLALGLYVSQFIEQIYLNNLEDRLSDEAKLISEQLIVDPELWADLAQLDDRVREWANILGVRVTIIAADGTVIGESVEDRVQMDNHLDRPEVIQAIKDGIGTSTRYSTTVGYPMMYTANAIYTEQILLGFVRLALPLTMVEAYTTQLRWTMISAACIVTVLAGGLAILIAEGVSRPIRELTRLAKEISLEEGLELGQGSVSTNSKGEIGLLTQAFHDMRIQLGLRIDALRVETVRLNAVLNKMSDGVLMVDRDGIVQLINPAAEKLFNVTQQAALNRPFAEVVRHHQLVDLFKRCQSSGDLQTVVLDIPLTRIYLQGIASPFGQTVPGNTLFVFQDLTRMRHLETVRRDFISNISHELRTPIASLKAVSETLLDGAIEDPKVARKFLLNINNEVDALSMMVSELLELSRIESGKVPLVFTEVSPCKILKTAIERLYIQADRAGLCIDLVCPEDLPLVLADPLRIEQVVVNLLHNAIKFTPIDGKIILSAEYLLIQDQPSAVQFSVKDNGVGIPEEDLPRIFERFYKADRARSGGGTGLGLAIARHLVDAHQGKIWVISREGTGSEFYFTIPLASEV